MPIQRLVKPGTGNYDTSRRRLRATQAFKQISWLNNASPDQIETYIENNVTSLATAKTVLKELAKVARLFAILLEARGE